MNPLDSTDTQVIIVGGGPVGLGLAVEVGQRGIRCIVVERYSVPQPTRVVGGRRSHDCGHLD
jgi:2-polyprenyl-6-methoxyphenol hydroxylase-like FAD-dependent oxidoreductase